MELNLRDLSERRVYSILTQVIIPRPIAWAITDNGKETGKHRWNIAPFSYFNGICSDPALVMFSVGDSLGGRTKDTHHNLLRNPLHTISIPSVGSVAWVQASSKDLPPNLSEAVLEDIPLTQWHRNAPRATEAPASLACEVIEFVSVGRSDQTLVISRIDAVWIDDEVATLTAEGRLRVDVIAFDPLARIGGGRYASVTPLAGVKPQITLGNPAIIT